MPNIRVVPSGLTPRKLPKLTQEERRIARAAARMWEAMYQQGRNMSPTRFLEYVTDQWGDAVPVQQFEAIVREVQNQVQQTSGRGAARAFDTWYDTHTPPRITSHMTAVFNGFDPAVVPVIQLRAATLVTNEGYNVIAGIRAAVNQSYVVGIEVPDLADQIKQMIGLLPRDATAVANMGAALTAQGTAPAEVARRMGEYTQRLLKQRALTIARTEVMWASHLGRESAWNQAINNGWLNPAESYKRWVTAPDERRCEICAPLHNQVVPLQSDWGGMAPPAHPNCRCTAALALKDDSGQVLKPWQEQSESFRTGRGAASYQQDTWNFPEPEVQKFNPHHASDGKFSSGPGGGKGGAPHLAPVGPGNETDVRLSADQLHDIGMRRLGLDDAAKAKSHVQGALAHEMVGRAKNDPELSDALRRLGANPDSSGFGMPTADVAMLLHMNPSQVRALQVGGKAGYEELGARVAAQRHLNMWASTAGDHDSDALTTQMVAARKWGLDDSYTRGKVDDSSTAARARVMRNLADPDHVRVTDAVLDAQYNYTQRELARAGITHVTVVRGVNLVDEYQFPPRGERIAKLSPLSSFSYSMDTASHFADDEYLGASIAVARVPAARVVGTWFSGFGCRGEQELVVMGAKKGSNEKVKWIDPFEEAEEW